MKVKILVGGFGNKIWPYNEIRNKCMIPISNRPLIAHNVETLLKCGIDDIEIIGNVFMDEIKHYFRREERVYVVELDQSMGSADTLLQSYICDEFFVFFGDCLIQENDIHMFLKSSPNTLLLGRILDDPHQHILTVTDEKKIKEFIAYPRGFDEGYFMVGGHFDISLFECLKYNRGRFTNTKVGVGSPNEKILEESLNDYLENYELKYMIAENHIFDIDKPWHILDANHYHNKMMCSLLFENQIDESASVDASASIDGYISLGKNSKIGKNVVIKGNIMVGDDTIIDNGAIIEECCVIGNHCLIQNHCKIGSYSTIGDYCIIEQTAELLGGMLMKKNYLYHHGEFYGLCGERCDLGAGTVCGTLRFDDGKTMHKVNGCKEYPLMYSNATFLGDYTRTGVGTIFLPGCIVGTNSVIGAGTILNKLVKSNTLIYPKQELEEKEWGYKKYGW